METIRQIIRRRDNENDDVIDEMFAAAKQAIHDLGEDPDDVLREEFGLEPDYMFDEEFFAILAGE